MTGLGKGKMEHEFYSMCFYECLCMCALCACGEEIGEASEGEAVMCRVLSIALPGIS